MYEYVQCRREQKRLREAAEAAATELGGAATASRAVAVAAAAAAEPGISDAGAVTWSSGDEPSHGAQSAPAAPAAPSPVEVVNTNAVVVEAKPSTVLAAVAVLTAERPQATDIDADANFDAVAAAADADADATAAAVDGEGEAEQLSSLSSGEWDPLGSGAVEAMDEEGLGGLPAAVAAAAETTEFYGERLAAAKRQLAESRERTARLRLRHQGRVREQQGRVERPAVEIGGT
jgi:hypothetical protein